MLTEPCHAQQKATSCWQLEQFSRYRAVLLRIGLKGILPNLDTTPRGVRVAAIDISDFILSIADIKVINGEAGKRGVASLATCYAYAAWDDGCPH